MKTNFKKQRKYFNILRRRLYNITTTFTTDLVSKIVIYVMYERMHAS